MFGVAGQSLVSSSDSAPLACGFVAKIGFSIYDGIHRETAVSARQVFGAVSTTRIHYTNIYVLKRPDEPYPAWRVLSDLICAYMSPLRNHGKLATHRPRPFNVAEAMGRSAFIILPYPSGSDHKNYLMSYKLT